jgi:AraC-like DNA-binding protein
MSRGLYREYAPAADLHGYVACTWISIAPHHARDRQSPHHEALPVIPDGCADVIAFGEAPPHVAGPATETQWVNPLPGTTIVGIRYRPGAARAVLHCDVHLMTNREPEVVSVCGGRGAALARDLDRAPDVFARRAAMESWTRAQLHHRRRADDVEMDVIAAIRLLTRDGGLPVDDVARQLGWSVRRMHRQFVRHCGYGPKLMQRVLRLQRAIARSRRRTAGEMALAHLAAAAGYTDQAHMTREFRSLTSFTPAEYLPGANPAVGQFFDW